MSNVDRSKPMACILTTPELRKRKETVIAALKSTILEKKETENGFLYRFLGSDDSLDMLVEFIKSERKCCDFFEFKLLVFTESEVWLEISGAVGAKEFIVSELGMI